MNQSSTLETGHPIDDPAARPWLDAACGLAADFSDQITGADPSERSLDLAIVLCAAEHVYATTGGRPHWSKLDVDAWLASVALMRGTETVFEAAAVTMQAYVSFLEQRAVLSAQDARTIGHALVPYTRAAWHRVLWGAMIV